MLIIYIIIIILLIINISLVLQTKKAQEKNDATKNLNIITQQMEVNKAIVTSKLESIHYDSNEKIEQLKKNNQQNFMTVSESLDKKVQGHNLQSLEQMKFTINQLEQKLINQNNNNMNLNKEIITQITKLDVMANHMDNLNGTINNLSGILNDKKSRGTFGEIRLQQLFEAIFGAPSKLVWERQFQLSNGKIVDFIMHGPEPVGDICIDSKFPLENYQNMINSVTDEESLQYKKAFKNDMKKHINDISEKYIIQGETALQAMMFIPSESIFAEIYANHEEIVNYSYEKKIWIASPTTLMAILNLLMVVLREVKQNENSLQMQKELGKLKVEFERFETRWKKVRADFGKIEKDMSDVDKTTTKIVNRFTAISDVELID